MHNFKIRDLELSDYLKNYFDLLNQLTTTNTPSYANFEKWFNIIKDRNRVLVIEDEAKQKIVASITLIVEYKFIHGCSSIGHIEDFVVDINYRNKNLGKKLVEHCIDLCKKNKCYKIILSCRNDLISYYHQYGFENKNVEMSLYF